MALEIQITDQDLPVLSVVATQALELLRDPDVSNRQMEDLIRQDPALTQRLLRTANAPFYAGRRPSQTISETIVRLGLRQLRSVLMVAATGELFDAGDAHIELLWKHSIATGLASQMLAETIRAANADEAFIAGMLHDVGQLVIYRQHKAAYSAVVEQARQTHRSLHESEEEVFKYFTHMSIGGLVVRKWNLSEDIAEAARFHHHVEKEEPTSLNNMSLTCLVSLASRLANWVGLGVTDGCGELLLEDLYCARRLGVRPERLPDLQRKIAEVSEAQQSLVV